MNKQNALFNLDVIAYELFETNSSKNAIQAEKLLRTFLKENPDLEPNSYELLNHLLYYTYNVGFYSGKGKGGSHE